MKFPEDQPDIPKLEGSTSEQEMIKAGAGELAHVETRRKSCEEMGTKTVLEVLQQEGSGASAELVAEAPSSDIRDDMRQNKKFIYGTEKVCPRPPQLLLMLSVLRYYLTISFCMSFYSEGSGSSELLTDSEPLMPETQVSGTVRLFLFSFPFPQ
jgi:hypothetical protein